MKKRGLFLKSAFITAVFCLSGLLANPAQAHRLNVFAWLESGMIMVESGFGDRHPARNAAVRVLDSQDGSELLRGQTDENGKFAFAVPRGIRHGLAIEVNAGEGHHGGWKISADELGEACPGGAGQLPADAANAAPAGANVALKDDAVQAGKAAVSGQAPMPRELDFATPEQVRAIVQEELEKKIAPVRREIAAQAASGPSLADIVGGIGWLVGLAGMAFYFKARRG